MEIIKESYESIGEFKELGRIQYDYYKNLATLSLASIGAIIAFVVKVFPNTTISPLYSVVAGLSLMCFSISLIVSIQGMPGPANYITYLTCLQIDLISVKSADQEKKVKEDQEKLKNCCKGMQKNNRRAKHAFISGVILFLLYAAIRLIG